MNAWTQDKNYIKMLIYEKILHIPFACKINDWMKICEKKCLTKNECVKKYIMKKDYMS